MWYVGMAKPLTAESVLTDIQRTAVYFRVVIRSFRSGETERLFRREPVRRFKTIERQALRKLDMFDAAPDIRTLSTVPGNRLEPLASASTTNAHLF
jgi:hypothetical protein